MKNEFSLPAFGWILLSGICLILIIVGLRSALKRAVLTLPIKEKIFYRTVSIIAIWTTLLLVLAYNGFFADFSKLPPRPALAVLIPLPVVLLFAFSKNGTKLLRSVPDHWLVYMQSFRVVVELMLLAAFTAGKLPVQMTFEGKNFDVATGILALPVGYLLMKKTRQSRKFAVAYNFVGLALLINILAIAILSMPTPIRYFMNEPANTIVAEFPYILLPGLLVPLAYGLHILSLRQLLSRSENKSSTTERVNVGQDLYRSVPGQIKGTETAVKASL